MGAIKYYFFPRWKKWLSYLKDIVIDSEISVHNGEMFVVLSKGRILLATEEAVYSWDDLYSNFYDTFDYLGKETIINWNKILVLGMGLGSIPFMLEKKFRSKASFVLVENDPAVVELAEYYSLPRLTNPYEIYSQDALDYVNKCKEKFDCICVDIFVGREVPEVFQKEAFLLHLKDYLNPGGVIIFNKLYMSKEDRESTDQLYHNFFSRIFHESEQRLTKFNMMLIGRK